MSNHTLKVIGVWNGDFKSALAILASENTELRIRQNGKKLIIKDTSINFYSCVAHGCHIEIPVYEQPNIVVDEPLEEPETRCQCCNGVISDEQKKLLKEWGLWIEDHITAIHVM